MAPTVPGVSPICKAEDRLVESIAASALFQAMTSSADAAAAKPHVYVGELPDPTDGEEFSDSEVDSIWPCAAILEDEEGGYSIEHTSDGGTFGYSGSFSFVVLIQRKRDDVPANQDEHRAFKEQMHGILAEMEALPITGNYFAITNGVPSNVWIDQPGESDRHKLMSIFLKVQHSVQQ